MVNKSLTHTSKKESTVKWLIIALIPVINIYFYWKLAENISGHEKTVSENYEVIKHMSKKQSTGKWFVIFLIPTFLGLIIAASSGLMATAGRAGMGSTMMLGGMGMLMSVVSLVSFVVGVFILYKVSETVSGHEKAISDSYEVVQHRDRKESTIKWFIIGIIPIVNLYLVWKTSEMVSGHEVTHG